MKKKGLKGLFRGMLLLILTLISVTAFSRNNVKASTYEDGTYTIPVSVYKTGTTTPSLSASFFGKDATVVIKNDIAAVTLQLQGTEAQFLSKTTVSGQSALSSDKKTLNFTMPAGTKTIQANFDIAIGAGMHQAADFAFDWSKVTPASDVTSKPDNSTTTTDNSTHNFNSSTNGQIINVSGSNNNITINNGSSDKTQGSTIDANATKLNYTVLQADEKSTSAANQYYTHVADIQKQSDGTYKITMHVQYGKNSGMTAKGFVPLTVSGQNVADVTYGSTADDYTCSFTFTTPTLDALTKAPVKGTVHVTVGLVNISSDFDVYYKFASTSGSATTNNQSAAPTSGNTNNGLNSGALPTAGAVETPASGASATTPTANTKTGAQKSSSALPQTNEVQDIAVAAAGLISLMLIVATVIYRRKQA